MVVKTDGGYFIKGKFVTHLDNQSTFDVWDADFKHHTTECSEVNFQERTDLFNTSESERKLIEFCENIKRCKCNESEYQNPFTWFANELIKTMNKLFR